MGSILNERDGGKRRASAASACSTTASATVSYISCPICPCMLNLIETKNATILYWATKL